MNELLKQAQIEFESLKYKEDDDLIAPEVLASLQDKEVVFNNIYEWLLEDLQINVKPGDLVIANIISQDGSGSKNRPCLLLFIENNTVAFFEITSVAPKELIKTNGERYVDLKSPITLWQSCGLNKQSYINYDHITKISKNMILGRQAIGKINSIDIKKLCQNIISNKQYLKKYSVEAVLALLANCN